MQGPLMKPREKGKFYFNLMPEQKYLFIYFRKSAYEAVEKAITVM